MRAVGRRKSNFWVVFVGVVLRFLCGPLRCLPRKAAIFPFANECCALWGSAQLGWELLYLLQANVRQGGCGVLGGKCTVGMLVVASRRQRGRAFLFWCSKSDQYRARAVVWRTPAGSVEAGAKK